MDSLDATKKINEWMEDATPPVTARFKMEMLEEAKRRGSSFKFPIHFLKKAFESKSGTMRALRVLMQEFGENIEEVTADSVIFRKEFDFINFIVPADMSMEFYIKYMQTWGALQPVKPVRLEDLPTPIKLSKVDHDLFAPTHPLSPLLQDIMVSEAIHRQCSISVDLEQLRGIYKEGMTPREKLAVFSIIAENNDARTDNGSVEIRRIRTGPCGKATCTLPSDLNNWTWDFFTNLYE